MNNNFFADRNDFFKYDLLLEILEKSRFLSQLTFVTMLTPADGRKGGGLTEYACGARRTELYGFLRECLTDDKRDIREPRRLFHTSQFKYTPYKDSQYFEHRAREEYFRDMPSSALRKALVFVDPDNGLEVSSTNSTSGDRYITYDELQGILNRCDDESILLVFQYLPRQNRRQYLQYTADSLRSRIRVDHAIFISDNRILFILLGKNIGNLEHLHHWLKSYAQKHKLLVASHGLLVN